MRFQGKITHWHDDQGYGFVTVNGGTQQTFVHISAFHGVRRRPLNGDLISYEIVTDNRGRSNANDVKYVRKPKSKPHLNTDTTWYGSTFALLFLSLLGLLVWLGKLSAIVLGIYLTASLITIAMYAADKRAALHNTWRKDESTLQFLAVIGGWPGALFAQKLLKHKNKKPLFQRVFWIAVIINLVIFALGFRYGV